MTEQPERTVFVWMDGYACGEGKHTLHSAVREALRLAREYDRAVEIGRRDETLKVYPPGVTLKHGSLVGSNVQMIPRYVVQRKAPLYDKPATVTPIVRGTLKAAP